jgi:hypothetical protein
LSGHPAFYIKIKAKIYTSWARKRTVQNLYMKVISVLFQVEIAVVHHHDVNDEKKKSAMLEDSSDL